MRVTATEAKIRFGSLSVKTNHDKSALAARKEKFEKEFGDWIDVQILIAKLTGYLALICALGKFSRAQYDL